MTDRWNSKLHTVDVVRPPKFFVPGDVGPTGDSSVVPRGKTWGIRERGDLSGTVVHSYRCPVHGLFDAKVPRAAVPEEVPCRVVESDWVPAASLAQVSATHVCGSTSTWAGSFCGQGHAAGETCS